MIKGLPEFEDIKKMKKQELLELKKSLENKIQTRKTKLPKLIKNYETVSKKYAEPKNAIEKSEVALAYNEIANTRVEIGILESYIREINENLEIIKAVEAFRAQNQPGSGE